MGAQPHAYRAKDDEWIKAAGLNPAEHPEFVSVEEFISRVYDLTTGATSGDQYDIGIDSGINWMMDELKENGFSQLQRRYTLKERFNLFGIKIVE